uniref:BTB domain-containing protein n=1 Tax=Acrobeloides nanus TaxID=290746 RepID=A0A914E1I8_9BILA
MPDPIIYDDFSQPTPVRNCQLIVENRSLYVNPGYLAEMSPYFGTIYEQQINPVSITELSYDQVLELMRVVFYCPQRKPITQGNVSIVVEAATYFEMEIVLRRCEQYITGHVGSFTNTRLFQLTQTLSKTNRYSPSMSMVVDKLAQLNDTELSTLPFNEIPGDIVADLYAVKMRIKDEKKGNQSKILQRTRSNLKRPKQGCCLFSWCS